MLSYEVAYRPVEATAHTMSLIDTDSFCNVPGMRGTVGWRSIFLPVIAGVASESSGSGGAPSLRILEPLIEGLGVWVVVDG